MVKPGTKEPQSKGNGKQREATLFTYNFVKRVRQDGVLVNVGSTMAKTVADNIYMKKRLLNTKNPQVSRSGRVVQNCSWTFAPTRSGNMHMKSSKNHRNYFANCSRRYELGLSKWTLCWRGQRFGFNDLRERGCEKNLKKGAASRKSYSYSFRMDVLTNFQENQKGADTISCSNVSINSWPDEMHLK